MTLCDLLTVFAETISVNKSGLHCISNHKKLSQFYLFFLLLDPQGNGIRVVKAPKLVKILPMEKMLPFEIDHEYADFAVKAIPDLSKLSKKVRIFVHRWRCMCFKIFQQLFSYFKVDIRDIKRMKRFGALENRDLSTCLSNENKTIVNHLLEKLGQVEEDDSTGKISSAITPPLFIYCFVLNPF